MKTIALTQGQFALVDDEDFEYLNQFKWFAQKHRNTFYAARNEGRPQIRVKMHRLIMNVVDNKIQIDHKFGNGLDNRKANLRFCTNTENQMNKSSRIGSTSIYKGVCWKLQCSKWVSQIKYNKNVIHIGLFNNEQDAAKAYNIKASELFGEYARLNII